ncbi:hypothetical protein ACA910_022504 [Epithemia clementina (nom. ined.)]
MKTTPFSSTATLSSSPSLTPKLIVGASNKKQNRPSIDLKTSRQYHRATVNEPRSPTIISSPWVNECISFFSSKELVDALENPPTLLSIWDKLLQKALAFVPGLVDLETCMPVPSLSTQLPVSPEHIGQVWDKIFLLIKAAYSVQEVFPIETTDLSSIPPSKASEGALHAVLGLARPNQKADSGETISFSLIVQRLIHEHPVELYRIQESTGRLPLHVVCAAPCTKARQNLLCTVLQANQEAACVRDEQGIYPLHLACQAGYPFEPTLELLWAAAPYVTELPCPCCPKQLLEQHGEMTSLCPSGSSSSTSIMLGALDSRDDTDDYGDASEFETVYTVLQSDPYLLAFSKATGGEGN